MSARPSRSTARPGAASLDELETAIGRGDYAVGDTLPASVVLAERYGVHRHTVRQAFRHLAEQGLVTVARGRGTQVSARRVPYPIGRRVSMRTNFGKLGIVGSSETLSTAMVTGEAETCAQLGLEAGAPLWRVEGLSLPTARRWEQARIGSRSSASRISTASSARRAPR
jgi:GntR family phosphonate transport system transcriptional regulator